MGLIWFDAHMDSHTPETSESQRIHGMPLACLLGYGYPTLTSIMHHQPKFKPENVCLIGVRSFESGEAAFLKRLNVRIYFMDEVKERGFDTVLQEAVELVSRHTIGYGLSIDLDGLDPQDAPGVDVPEIDGVGAVDFCAALKKVVSDPRLIATEVVEFDPTKDVARKTEILVADILKIIATGAVKA
jgi:arginase